MENPHKAVGKLVNPVCEAFEVSTGLDTCACQQSQLFLQMGHLVPLSKPVSVKHPPGPSLPKLMAQLTLSKPVYTNR